VNLTRPRSDIPASGVFSPRDMSRLGSTAQTSSGLNRRISAGAPGANDPVFRPHSLAGTVLSNAMTFDIDGAASHTYPAINVGAKIGYRVSPRVQLLLSPQGDIAFTKDAEVGTSNAWVWPFTVGLRIGL